MEAYIAAYLRDHDRKDPYASPLYAAELGGLPPALVATAEYDPLTDEGHAYVARLRQADVEVEHHHLPGLVHASFAFTRLLPVAQEYEQTAVAALRRARSEEHTSELQSLMRISYAVLCLPKTIT